MARVESARLIDVRHQGLDRVIGAWTVDGVVIDPGPEPCTDELLAGLGGQPPRTLLLTHIHLDHAGAAGALVRRFADLVVYVHERGAPHLADPSRLLASAERLYGDQMEELWGEVVPVPERNLRPLSGGETVEGFAVAYTPGHASHHVAFLHEHSGDAFVGDVAGVRIPPAGSQSGGEGAEAALVIPPTPPPEIDLAAWEQSLEEIGKWSPGRLRLTHFGSIDDPGPHLALVREQLRRRAEQVRRLDRERFLEALDAEIDSRADPDDARRLRLAVPPDHVWMGLHRYWEKRGVLESE